MIPITDVKTMRESDAATIAGGISGKELMMRAGQGIYASYPWRGKTAIVCGHGNNAGDGYVLALQLTDACIPCALILLDECFSEDGKFYYDQCIDRGVEVIRYSSDMIFDAYREIVDCIFGTGFSGEVRGAAAEVIEKINQSGKHVISADINSGLNGDNGTGTLCIRSDLTVSIGSYKAGHFLNRAKDIIASLCNIDIGINVPDRGVYLAEALDFGRILRPRSQFSNKGDYGYVTVMGGCREYAGAVKLASMSAAALRAGCGVAQLAVPEAIANSISPYLLESTLLPIPSDEAGHMQYCPDILNTMLSRQAAVAIGMGWGRTAANAKILEHILKNGSIKLVIDADGLNTLSEMDLLLLKNTACKIVLTPHLKEFERLSGIPIADVVKNPVHYAKCFAKAYGVVLLLKGTCTVVTDGEVVYLVNRGCAGMATAGSGDVLSGILAGLLGYSDVTALTVACGAYIAGRAGELAERNVNPISMVASDTVAHIAQTVCEMMGGQSAR
ncbi:MAG: NAD(P)H-hydrate dehydratase [Clostridia bacterium]|nr:NAD(P)H-hydrate dehydratase [Clostridia bacterium]